MSGNLRSCSRGGYDAALYMPFAATRISRVLDFASFLRRYACGERIDCATVPCADAVSPAAVRFPALVRRGPRGGLMQRRKGAALCSTSTIRCGAVCWAKGPPGTWRRLSGQCHTPLPAGIAELARRGDPGRVTQQKQRADVRSGVGGAIELWCCGAGDFAARRQGGQHPRRWRPAQHRARQHGLRGRQPGRAGTRAADGARWPFPTSRSSPTGCRSSCAS